MDVRKVLGAALVLIALSAFLAPLARPQSASCDDDPGLRRKECKEAYDKRTRWERITADNGAVYQIDVGNLRRTPPIYVSLWAWEGSSWAVPPTAMIFNCNGYFSVIGERGELSTEYAPPRSVAARIEALVCRPAK
jgi:hypothetical protein